MVGLRFMPRTLIGYGFRQAVAGGSLGVVIQRGIARGIFSNESGMGTAPIAQAAARPGDPVLQGTVAMIGTFIDTIVVCSMTALVIVISGLYTTGESGVALTMSAFDQELAGSAWLVNFGTVFRLTRAYDFKATERSA